MTAVICASALFPLAAKAEDKRPTIPSGESTVYKELIDEPPRYLKYKKHSFSIHAGGGATQSKFSLNGISRSAFTTDVSNEDSLDNANVNFSVGHAYYFNPRIRLESDLSYALNPDESTQLSDQFLFDFRNQVRATLLVGFRLFKSRSWKIYSSVGAGIQSYPDLESVVAGPGLIAKLEAEYVGFSVKFSPYYFRHGIQNGEEIRNYNVQSNSYIDQYGADLSLGWVKRF